MKEQITILFLAIITFLSCNTSSNSSQPSSSLEEVNKTKTPEELKVELAALEKSFPLKYLTIDCSMEADEVKIRDAGLFHEAEYSPDGNTIYGTIQNSATVAKFKDIVITVTYYSQTETVISSEDFTFYEFYEPNAIVTFQQKVYPPKEMSKFGIEIKNATPVD